MAGGLPPAPRWAWIVMALGVVAIGVMTYLAVNRPPPPGFAAPAAARVTTDGASTTSTPSATPASEPTSTPAEETRVLVVGDAFTAGSGAGGEGPAGWPQLVGGRLEADGRSVIVDVAAADGSGYVEAGPAGATFGQLAESAGETYDLVVFSGSRHDTAAAPEVQTAARAAFAAAPRAPGAALLVVGPVWLDAQPPGYIVTNRDAVGAAAAETGARFVDPLAGQWLVGDAAAVAPSGRQLTDAGHRQVAELVLPRIVEALDAAP